MTNAKKFKTAKERAIEFNRFCISTCCADCGLMNRRANGECYLAWLDLEYKEELKPCPFCGGTPVMADNVVKCACRARTASAFSESVAAEIWNRRVQMKKEEHKPCKFRKREVIDGDVELDMCYAIGFERRGDIPCEYCSDRKTKEDVWTNALS